MSVDLFNPNELGFDNPAEAVEKLKADARRAEETSKRYADLASGYYRKLAAIRELAPYLFPEDRASHTPTPSEPGASAPKTVIDAVVEAVDNADRPLLPKEIRAAIIAQGDGGLLTNENYLYTAIKRATDSKRIARVGDTYLPAPKREGPEE